MTQEEKIEFIKKQAELARNNFAGFCSFFLSKQFKLKSAKFHEDLFKICENDSLKRCVIVAPRKHAKSTIMTFAFVIWKACYCKDLKILVISNTGKYAIKWLRRIKKEFETNILLQVAFGDLRTAKWAEDNIELLNDISIEALGRGQQSRGAEYNIIICDDLEDEELVRSSTQMDYFVEWFDGTLYNTAGHNDRIIYIGTILSQGCFLSRLIKDTNRKEIWKSWFYQAYIDGVEAEGHELWAEKHPHNALQDKKKNNPYVFAREQMNMPGSAGEGTIQEIWLQYFDETPDKLRITVTIDPSGISSAKQSDMCGIIILGLDVLKNMYVLEAIGRKYDPHSLLLELYRIQRQYQPYKMGIEANALQNVLKFYLVEMSKVEKTYLPLEGLDTPNRLSKNMRIASLIPYFAEKRIFLKRSQYDLISQLRQYPHDQEYDDLIDAFGYQPQIMLAPEGQSDLTQEEIQKRLNEAAYKRVFGEEMKRKEARTCTGYRYNFTVGK